MPAQETKEGIVKRNPSEFVKVWNASESLPAAVSALGGTQGACEQYAWKLRQRGYELKDFKVLDYAHAPEARPSLAMYFFAVKALAER
jgi:hypothetical protein